MRDGNDPTTTEPARPPHAPMIERRSGKNRRARPTPALSLFSFGRGRRTRERRRDLRRQGFYVDRYERPLLWLLAALCALNVLDGVYTLIQIERGGYEVNPVVIRMLELDPAIFLLVKSIGMGVVAILLCLHSRFRFGRWAIVLGLTMYLGVCIYHRVTLPS